MMQWNLHYLLLLHVCMYVGKSIFKVHGTTKCSICFNPDVQRKVKNVYWEIGNSDKNKYSNSLWLMDCF